MEKSRYTCGSTRVRKEIQNTEDKVSRSLIARVMGKYRFRSVYKKKFKVTTDSKHTHPVSDNVLNRDFTAERPTQKWV